MTLFNYLLAKEWMSSPLISHNPTEIPSGKNIGLVKTLPRELMSWGKPQAAMFMNSQSFSTFLQALAEDIINVSEVLLIFLYCSLASVPVVFHRSIVLVLEGTQYLLLVGESFSSLMSCKIKWNISAGSLKLGRQSSTTINPSSHSALSGIDFIIFLNVLLY